MIHRFYWYFFQGHSSSLISTTKVCVKCKREFDVDDNPGNGCVHSGTWHVAFNDCSYLKCGYHLAKTASIGKQHWSCCYSLDGQSTICTKSDPHTYIKH